MTPVTDTADVAVETESDSSIDPGGDVLGVPHSAHHSSGNFPGIGDYAFLSDCESNCLIAPSGAIEWMCVPRPDSPSVFTALLDRAGGSFRVAPFGVAVPAARRYLPGTLVLETTWQTPTGWLVVRDALDHGALAQHRPAVQDPPPVPHRLRRRACAAAQHQVHLRQRRPADELRAGLRLRPQGCQMELPEFGLLRGDRQRQGSADAPSCPVHCGSASRAAPRWPAPR